MVKSAKGALLATLQIDKGSDNADLSTARKLSQASDLRGQLALQTKTSIHP